jgi:hypothetical protein
LGVMPSSAQAAAQAAAVAAAVFDDHPADGHATVANHATARRSTAVGDDAEFVVVDLDVGQSAMVVEHDVDRAVAHQRVVVVAAGPAAVGAAIKNSFQNDRELPVADEGAGQLE